MSKTLNGVPFRQILVSTSKHRIKAPYSMNAKKVTLHETDNQASAINEINYMNSNNNQTSYHVAVDEKEAIQGIPFNRNAWHAGDGGNGYGNRNTLSFEICRNYDRTRQTTALLEPLSSKYQNGVRNAIKVVAQIMVDQGIVANNSNIKTHNDWNGKHCPRKMRNDGRVLIVKAGIIAEYNRLKGLPAPKPATPLQSKKVDGHLSFSQVVDKTIAGGYGNGSARKTNITKRTNYTYAAVQKAVDAKLSTPVKKVAKPKPQTTNKLSVDGYWGPATTCALQRHYGTTVDGKITGQPNNASVRNIPSATTAGSGSLLVRAMQKDLGTTQDGKISAPSLMIRALQKRLGTPVDGLVSKPSLMVKEMQKRLNNGTF